MGFTRRRCLMKTEYIAKDTFDKTVSELRQQIANLTSTVSAIGGGGTSLEPCVWWNTD